MLRENESTEVLNPDPPQETEEKSRRMPNILRLLLKSKTGTLGLIIVIAVVVISIFAPQLSPHEPNKVNPAVLLKPPCWDESGSWEYVLGTDNLGRDILSRLFYGSRISLIVGIFSVVVAGIIGIVMGLISGFYGGFIDSLVMRVVDSFLSIPKVLIALVVLGVVGPGTFTIIFVIGITNWVVYARLVRGEVLSIKEREFVKAARTVGSSDTFIIMKHILPNVFSSFIVVSTLTVASSIIFEASLSFLGVGIQPPTVTWGGMLTDGRNYLASNWWIATFPGLAITVTVLGIMFLGNWLRDLNDPHNQGLNK